jgi:hypothetical protein
MIARKLFQGWWPDILAALILAACRTPVQPTPTATPIPLAPLPTRTLTPTPTTTLAIPTATTIPDTEPSLDALLVNDILFRRGVAGWSLPCWEGLRIGEAGVGDVQRVMDSTFGFRSSVDFFATPPNIGALWIPDIPGTISAGHSWTVNNGVSVLRLLFVIDERGILQGIEFTLLSVGPYQGYTPQEIIRRMGKPDHIALHVGPSPNPQGGSDTVSFLVMLYHEGFAYSYRRTLPRAEASSSEYCLDVPPSGAAYHILPPFEDFTPATANPLQALWVFDVIARDRLQSIEETLSMSTGAFTELALSASPCFGADVP